MTPVVSVYRHSNSLKARVILSTEVSKSGLILYYIITT